MRIAIIAPMLFAAGLASGATPLADAPHLYGIHWYGDASPLNSAAAGETDAERMAAGSKLWVLEINHLDNFTRDPDPAANGIQATPWDRPEWYANLGLGGGHNDRVTAKGHSLIYRIQPNWGRNVPYFEAPGSPNNDPFTLELYAAQARNAAWWHRRHARFWQVGNEVNIGETENRRWNPATGRYDIHWKPSPAQYAETYLAVRDAIHEITPEMAVPRQVVLMQPCSPGEIPLPGEGERYIDGNEFLWRQIAAVPGDQRHRIDGFALHAYAEPGGPNDGLDGFMDTIREQLMIIDEHGLHDRPVLITEFNKHMPSREDAAIAARFVQKSYEALNEWNTGTGGAWPGQPNHEIVAATWFSFPREDDGIWKDYSIVTQGLLSGSDDPNINPFRGFQAVAAKGLPHGSLQGDGAIVDHAALWWSDDFNRIDTEPSLPDWRSRMKGSAAATAVGGSALLTAADEGAEAALVTEGYCYGNLTTLITFRLAPDLPAGRHLQFVLREGSSGYAFTIAGTAEGPMASLRRRKDNTILSQQSLPQGTIATFRLWYRADDATITARLYRDDDREPIIAFQVNDDHLVAGRIAIRSTLPEARIDHIAVGGRDWPGE